MGDYVHRVGRTARAGRPGLSLSLVSQYDVWKFLKIEAAVQTKMEEYPFNEDMLHVFKEEIQQKWREATSRVRDLERTAQEDGTRGIRQEWQDRKMPDQIDLASTGTLME